MVILISSLSYMASRQKVGALYISTFGPPIVPLQPSALRLNALKPKSLLPPSAHCPFLIFSIFISLNALSAPVTRPVQQLC